MAQPLRPGPDADGVETLRPEEEQLSAVGDHRVVAGSFADQRHRLGDVATRRQSLKVTRCVGNSNVTHV